MWGGRYKSGPAEIMEENNASIGFDQTLWRQDIRGSIAHVTMLAETGIVTRADAKAITAGLQGIGKEIEAGTFTFSRALEDIHLNVESALTKRIGPAGGGCTRAAPATIRSRSICGSGCATRWTTSFCRSRI